MIEIGGLYWWLVLLITSIVVWCAMWMRSLQGASLAVIVGCSILIVFGDYILYLMALWPISDLLYAIAVYFVGIGLSGLIQMAISGWAMPISEVILHAWLWPWTIPMAIVRGIYYLITYLKNRKAA